jgi:hypothetical protein
LNRVFGYVGVVAAVVVASWLGLAALYFESYRRGLVKIYRRTLADISKMLLASVAMGWMVRLGSMGLVSDMSVYSFWQSSAMLGLLICAGMAFYAGMMFLAGLVSMVKLKALLGKS